MKASHPDVATATRVNPGETLRKARENKEWALADVAAQLNLTVQALRLVESGAFDQLPGHTFSRGYIRSYAKLLGMDSNRLVADFDQYTGTDSQGSSVASLGRIEEPARVSHNLLRGFSVLVLVALGAAGFFWWQGESSNTAARLANTGIEHVEVEAADGTTEIHPLDEPEDQAIVEVQGDDEQPLTDPALAPEVPAGAPEALAGEAPVAPVPVAPTATESAPVAVTPPANAVVPVVPTQAPVPAEPVATAPPAAAPSAPVVAPAAGDSRVSLMFSADCWAQLTDASGKVLVSALKRKGESLELYGKAPFELRLGYARGAVVSFNGQQVDVGPFTHGETARIKLGQ